MLRNTLLLSQHFTLGELTKSQTATRYGLSNEPNAEQFKALQILCVECLEQVRRLYNFPLKISSGFRSTAVNKRVGGSNTSQHCKGQAADFDYEPFGISNKRLLYNIVSHNIPYDQIIYEFGQWVHISHVGKDRNRGQILEAYKQGKRVVYRTLSKDEVRMMAMEWGPSTNKGLQNILHELGLYYGTLDGIIGPKTEEAIKAFQRRNKISQTGKFDGQVAKLLTEWVS